MIAGQGDTGEVKAHITTVTSDKPLENEADALQDSKVQRESPEVSSSHTPEGMRNNSY